MYKLINYLSSYYFYRRVNTSTLLSNETEVATGITEVIKIPSLESVFLSFLFSKNLSVLIIIINTR